MHLSFYAFVDLKLMKILQNKFSIKRLLILYGHINVKVGQYVVLRKKRYNEWNSGKTRLSYLYTFSINVLLHKIGNLIL